MTPRRIVIHCSATPNGRDVHVEEIRRWHLAKGWSDIGYHGVIAIDGGFSQGRPDDRIGAHVEGHNDGSLGVCLVGTDRFSPLQFQTLSWYLTNKRAAYGISTDQVFGHYQFDSAQKQGKTCPNIRIEDLRAWYLESDELRALDIIRPYLLVPSIP